MLRLELIPSPTPVLPPGLRSQPFLILPLSLFLLCDMGTRVATVLEYCEDNMKEHTGACCNSNSAYSQYLALCSVLHISHLAHMKVELLFPFWKQGQEGSERLGNSPEVTQPVNRRG